MLEGHTATAGDGFDKLQVELLRMSPGDELTVDRAAELSGLDRATCTFVLDALAKAGLMIAQPRESYLRCRLQTANQATH